MAEITIKEALIMLANASKNYTDKNKPDLTNYATVDHSHNNYAATGHSHSQYATSSYVDTSIANLVNSAPSTLDTLNELAAALGNDANFATTVANQLGTKVTKEEGTLDNPIKVWELNDGLHFIYNYKLNSTSDVINSSMILTVDSIETKKLITTFTGRMILDESGNMIMDDYFVSYKNELPYTPTTDYQPATKKYVDEKVAAGGGSTAPSFGNWVISEDASGNLNFTYNG